MTTKRKFLIFMQAIILLYITLIFLSWFANTGLSSYDKYWTELTAQLFPMGFPSFPFATEFQATTIILYLLPVSIYLAFMTLSFSAFVVTSIGLPWLGFIYLNFKNLRDQSIKWIEGIMIKIFFYLCLCTLSVVGALLFHVSVIDKFSDFMMISNNATDPTFIFTTTFYIFITLIVVSLLLSAQGWKLAKNLSELTMSHPKIDKGLS